jgi:hypothetical protein
MKPWSWWWEARESAELPVTVVDTEAVPPLIVARCATVATAETWIGGITDRDKVERGAYAVGAPL